MIRQEIIENAAINSLAKTLRLLTEAKKYGHVDDLKTATSEGASFGNWFANMLYAVSRHHFHVPTEAEIKEIVRIANDDFEETKLAILILSLAKDSGPKKTYLGIEENLCSL